MTEKENPERFSNPTKEPIKVFCQNPTKIEEIYKYLYKESIPFKLTGLGLQRIILPSFEAYQKLAEVDDGWFEAIGVKKFPEENYKQRWKPFNTSGPDHFVPIESWSIPQQKRPLREVDKNE